MENSIAQLSSLSAEALEDFLHYTPTPSPQPCPGDDELTKCLHDVFQLQAFQPMQLEIIRAVIEGQHCFIRMATGSGKSLLWQLPAVYQMGVTVVVLPTTSLIMDQMRRLCKIMSPSYVALCYYADLPTKLKDFTLWLLARPYLKSPNCLLLTPNQLGHDPIKSLLMGLHKSGHLTHFVIDEVDKFLTWGQSFYNDYLILQDLQKTFPRIPILAMTGSITMKDMDDCIEKLGMQNCAKFSCSLDRPNLCYEVKQKHKDRWSLIKDIVDLTRKGSGIVYCIFKRETEEIAALLRNRGINAQAYYGPLEEMEKNQILNKWKRDELAVVVATTAFGMGIDKHNVRWVVHDTMPSSIEGWFQESGRAGRDGKPAHSIIYFQVEDYYKVKQLIGKPSNLTLSSCLKPYHKLIEIMLNSTSCRRQQLLNYFGEKYTQDNCGACDFCKYAWAHPWSRQNVTVDAQNAINLLGQMCKLQPHWTEKQLAEAMFGRKTEKLKRHAVTSLETFGCGFSLTNGQNATKPQIQEFILLLILKGVIMEYRDEVEKGAQTYRNYYIEPRVRVEEIAAMGLHMNLPIFNAHSDQNGDATAGASRVQEVSKMADVIVIDSDEE